MRGRAAPLVARLALLLLALVAAFAPDPAAARKRLVGIVFDDSGSMDGRFHLAAFGAQVLASSLSPEDRLFSIRLSEFEAAIEANPALRDRLAAAATYPIPLAPTITALAGNLVEERPLPGPAAQQALVDAIRDGWTAPPSTDTPFEPLELMLQRLAAETGPEDEAFLIVLTDGKIERGTRFRGPDLPRAPDLARLFAHYRTAMRGRLRADYVLISPAGNASRAFLETVNQQAVAATLLGTFNGTANEGLRVVTDTAGLVDAMLDVIARVSSTDRSDRSDFARIDGARILVDSPFSLHRLTVVVDGPADARLPAVAGTSFSGAAPIEIGSRMAADDVRRNWRSPARAARTSRFAFDPALPPGTVTVDFDRPVGANTLLLFDTQARIELGVVDTGGAPVAPRADGVVEVVAGGAYRIAALLYDRDPAAPRGARRVPFAELPASTAFRGRIEGAAPMPLAFARDDGGDRALAPFGTTVPGRMAALAEFSLPGFVIKTARPLVIEVVPPAAGLAMTIEPAPDCTACRGGDLVDDGRDPAGERRLGTLVIRRSDGGPLGEVRLVPESLPDGLALVPEDRGAVDGPFPLGPGDERRLAIVRRPFTGPPPRGDASLELRLEAVAPLRGSAKVAGSFRVDRSGLSLVYAGVDGAGALSDPAPDDVGTQAAAAAPAVLDLDALSRGIALVFEVRGLFPGERLEAGDVVVPEPGWLAATVVVRPDGRSVAATVSSARCACVLGLLQVFGRLPTGIDAVLAPGGPESARATAPVRAAIDLRTAALDCLLRLLLALAALYALVVGFFVATAYRFPKTAFAEIDRPGPSSGLPARRELRAEPAPRGAARWHYPLIFRHAHQRRDVEGLVIEARPNGATLILADSEPDIQMLGKGRTVGDVRREQPRLATLPVAWGEPFMRPRVFRSLQLRRE
ncbi:hypothetical protein [Methylobrevis albus]|uniref:VWFA domain-containing protein n=1 Tax=Methylobrevis albus TaxID=2793297 RepID=A0A931I3G4_9HYPH|nr:hypothetical protein [Methylobrevis albus]MBH0238576.1 hypothetical protein [Methylobrevis albus]